LTVLKPSEQPK